MSTHNICFHREIREILCEYSILSVAMPPSTDSRKAIVSYLESYVHKYILYWLTSLRTKPGQ